MQEQLHNRLEALKKEFETGQARLKELETEEAYVRETLLRISGAIQVLQELLEKNGREAGDKPPNKDDVASPAKA
jgi:predicted nuclease with TOPRIM domain